MLGRRCLRFLGLAVVLMPGMCPPPAACQSVSSARIVVGQLAARMAAAKGRAPARASTPKRHGFWEGLRAFFEVRLNADGRFDPDAYVPALKHRAQMPAMPRHGGPADGAGVKPMALGASWEYLGPVNWQTDGLAYMGSGATAGCIVSVSYDPSNPGTYYAGAAEGGVWKTTDSGVTWTPLTDKWPCLAVGALAVDPQRPHIVYAGTGSWRIGYTTPCVLMRSMDGGNTWSDKTPPGFPNKAIRTIVVDPDNPDIVMFGTGGFRDGKGSIYRSINYGTTWQEVLADTGRYQSIVYSPVRPNGHRRYYAAGEAFDGSLYRSDDEGATWEQLTPPWSSVGGTDWDHQNGLRVACSPVDPNTVYIICGRDTKVWRNTHGGDNGEWEDITGILATDFSSTWNQYSGDILITCSTRGSGPSRTDVLYVGLVGIFQSPSADGTWQEYSQLTYGAIHCDHHAVAIDPADPNRMLIANDGGVYRGVYDPVAGTASFTSLNADLQVAQFYRIAVHPNDPDVAIGGSQDNATATWLGSPPAWHTRSGGDSGMPAICESIGDIRYVTSFSGGIDTCTASPWVNWTGITPDWGTDRRRSVMPVATDPSNSRYLYMGSNYLWRYNRTTGLWTSRLGGTELAPDGQTLGAIAIAPTDSRVIYVGSGGGHLWVSVDTGSTWKRLDIAGSPLPNRGVTDIAVDPAKPKRILVTFGGSEAGRLWVCNDTSAVVPTFGCLDGSGATGLPAIQFSSVVIDPYDPTNTFYVGGDVGVFATLDGGQNWSNAGGPLGLPNTIVTDLQIGKNTNCLYAGTMGRGIWRMPLRSYGIMLIEPNGGQSYERGGSMTVRWKDTGSALLVDLWLLRNGAKYRQIADNIAPDSSGSGTYAWTIPTDVTTGSAYRVLVETTIGGYTDTGDADFTIVAAPAFSVREPGVGDSWEQGSTHDIEWTYTGSPTSRVRLQLLHNGLVVRTIADSVPVGTAGAGSHSWTVPPTMNPSTHYQVRLTEVAAPTHGDDGAEFTIAARNAITVTEPAGGDSWPLTTTQTVEWDYSGAVGSTVTIKLYRLGAFVRDIASGQPIGTSGSGSYSWTIAADITPNVGYAVRVISVSAPAVYDDSGPFTIAQSRARLVLDGATGRIGYQVTLHARMTNWYTGDPVSGKTITFSRDAHDFIGTAVTNALGDASLVYRIPETTAVTAHALYATFDGDATYDPREDIDSLDIDQGISTMFIGYATVFATQFVTLRASLNRQPDSAPVVGRVVTLWLAGDLIGEGTTSTSGGISLRYKVPELPPGDYALKAVYSGDVSYAGSEDTEVLRVMRCDTFLNPAAVSGQIGETVMLNARLWRASDSMPLVGREIVFSVAGAEVGRDRTDRNGYAETPYTIPESLGWGGKTYTAAWAGEPAYVGHSQIATLTVAKANVTIDIPDISSAVGNWFEVTARITRASDGAPLAGRVVVFSIDGTTIGQDESDDSGDLLVNWLGLESYGPGDHRIDGTFAGDLFHKPGAGTGNLNLVKGATTLSTIDRAGVITTLTILRAYLKRAVDSSSLSGRTVVFDVDSTVVGSAVTDATGRASLSWVIDCTPGVHAIGAKFNGDANYTGSTASALLTGTVVTTKVYVPARTGRIKQRAVLRAFLFTLANVAIPGKTLAVRVDGTLVGSKTTDSSGRVEFYYTVPEGAGAGARVIRGEWAGNAGYTASAATGTLTVSQGDLYIWLYVRSGKVGTAHPLKAYVRSLPDYVIQPGKAFTFRVNGTDVGSTTVAATGWAIVTWNIPAGEPTGANTAAAVFAGDAWYLAQTKNAAFNVVP